MTERMEARFVRKTRRNELTDVEKDTLRLVAHGATNEDIAEATKRSLHTVKSRIVRLMTLLGANNRAELVHEAYQRGFLMAPDGAALLAEVKELKAKLAGVSNKNRENFHKAKELQAKLEEQQREINRLTEVNRRIGGQALEWLDSGQGRL